ncbi:MAG: hypothetical protein J5798_09405 [Spirochaetaceae bacterium]|nr:hypothetical protein [Spirochaetaceae bacterium]MBO4727975.1 hypothetical protein [Spirochaetaceae bacterium]MBR4823692.1 hypothetical protein [Spirochaetaceae bacterium]
MADYITFYYKKTGGLVKLPNKKDLQNAVGVVEFIKSVQSKNRFILGAKDD